MNPPGDWANQGRRGAAGGAPGWPSGMFPDPFAGLMGHMGMGRGRSVFDDFFSQDPFDDPFFNRPFGSMFGPAAGFFGNSGQMGSFSMLDNGGFFSPSFAPHTSFLQQRAVRPNLPQTEDRRGPVIEELPDDDDDNEPSEAKSQGNHQPIIEHPDDDFRPVAPGIQHRDQSQSSQSQVQSFRGPLVNNGNGYRPSSRFESFSFQSSSVSYGSGNGGRYYSSSSSQTVGPDGVMEEEHLERDSSGRESRSIARGYRDKVHAITKKREANGPENTLETLHNLTAEEAPEFDTQWEAHAQRSLPGWRHRPQMLESSRPRVNRQVPHMLTYNNPSSHQQR